MSTFELTPTELTQTEHRSIKRIWHELRAIADEIDNVERVHWARCFELVLRMFTLVETAKSPSISLYFSDDDKASLMALRPELERLLSTQWQHGQWKLGELRAWETVWVLLLDLGELVMPEVKP